MRKWHIFVVLLGIVLYPSTVGAEDGIKLQSMNIQLWAEYDQPSVLVIHEFTVDESTALPVQVTLRLPKEGNLIAVAYQENDGLVNADFSGPEEQGNWQTVTLNVQSYAPHRIEYYQPLNRDGKQRLFSFRWFGDYTVNEFNVTAQIPADSTNVTSEPAFSNTNASEDGLHLVGMVRRGQLRMGQSNEFKIQYEREAETVTNPSNSSNIQPAEPIGSDTEGRVSIDNLPWIIGGFGLALIGLALFFYFRSTQAPERKSRRRRGSVQTAEESDTEQAYCHECGARAHQGDRFCRICGSKIRV